MTQQGDVFDVYKYLFHGNIFFASKFHLQLHASNKNFIDAFILFMELLLFVVESVENVFYV